MCVFPGPSQTAQHCRNFLFPSGPWLDVSINRRALWPYMTSSKHVHSTSCLHCRSSGVWAMQTPWRWASGAALTRVRSQPPFKHTCQDRHLLEPAASITASQVCTPKMPLPPPNPFPVGLLVQSRWKWPWSLPWAVSIVPRCFPQVCLFLFSSRFYPWCPSCPGDRPSPPFPLLPSPGLCCSGHPPSMAQGPCLNLPSPPRGGGCHEAGDHPPHVVSLRIPRPMPSHMPMRHRWGILNWDLEKDVVSLTLGANAWRSLSISSVSAVERVRPAALSPCMVVAVNFVVGFLNKDALEKARLPTPVFWPGEFCGLDSPWGHKESDTTERLALTHSS